MNNKKSDIQNISKLYVESVVTPAEDNEPFYTTTYLEQKLGSTIAAFEIMDRYAQDHLTKRDPEGDNARDYLLSLDNADDVEAELHGYFDP